MNEVQRELRELADEKIAEHSQSFFKTAKGEYGYGDLFLGIRVPQVRKVAKRHTDLSYTKTQTLIKSKYHEERLLGLVILVNKYEKAKDDKEKQKIYELYIKNFKFINNWDLVDVTCPRIIGRHLMEADRTVLYRWAKSDDLWTRRISIMANWWFIRNDDLSDVFKISKILLSDPHDLIHKAVGWMLREAGKKNMKLTEAFMRQHYKKMPRTMLRYAIEKYPESKRQRYLKGKV